MFPCFAAVVLVAAGLPAMGQGASGAKSAAKPATKPAGAAPAAAASMAGLKCTGDDGSACSPAQVADLNSGILVGRRQHEPLRLVQAVSQGPNGQLKCTQTNGSACTDAQLSTVIEVAEETAAASKTKNKGGGGFHVMKSIDVASP
jgi:hypothetical protein